jgi:hypothetical protein
LFPRFSAREAGLLSWVLRRQENGDEPRRV